MESILSPLRVARCACVRECAGVELARHVLHEEVVLERVKDDRSPVRLITYGLVLRLAVKQR